VSQAPPAMKCVWCQSPTRSINLLFNEITFTGTRKSNKESLCRGIGAIRHAQGQFSLWLYPIFFVHYYKTNWDVKTQVFCEVMSFRPANSYRFVEEALFRRLQGPAVQEIHFMLVLVFQAVILIKTLSACTSTRFLTILNMCLKGYTG